MCCHHVLQAGVLCTSVSCMLQAVQRVCLLCVVLITKSLCKVKHIGQGTAKGADKDKNACRYVDQCQASGEAFVPSSARTSTAQTYCYVIYLRASPLPLLINALKSCFARQYARKQPVYLWLDFLSADLNLAMPAAIATAGTFARGASQAIVVMDELGELFTRAWCIYEVFMFVTAGGDRPLQVLVNNAFGGDEVQLVDALFATSLTFAKTSRPDDLPELLAAMRVARQATAKQTGSGRVAHVATVVADALWRSLCAQLARVARPAKGELATIETVKVCHCIQNTQHVRSGTR
jgi:hypothetical protein